jgi:hypothetical protein
MKIALFLDTIYIYCRQIGEFRDLGIEGLKDKINQLK